jgi:hypothetical protein
VCFIDLGDECNNIGVNFQERIETLIFNKIPETCKPHKAPLNKGYLGCFSVLKRRAFPSFPSSAAKYKRNFFSPYGVAAISSSLLRFRDHTQRHTTISRTPLDKYNRNWKDIFPYLNRFLKKRKL